MKNKPVIGMAIAQLPKLIQGKHIFNSPYIHAIELTGGIPLLLPATGTKAYAETYIRLIDGLLLPGGVDVNPLRYGEDPVRQVTYLSDELDELELELIRLAVQQNKPVFGICRGMQLINVAFGGTLYQDLPSEYPNCIGHSQDMAIRSQLTHRVKLSHGSLTASVLGKTELCVNSYHHQAVKDIAPGFVVSGKAFDGVVEAIENPEQNIWGVQWHPEELVDDYPDFQKLFRHLVELSTPEH